MVALGREEGDGIDGLGGKSSLKDIDAQSDIDATMTRGGTPAV